MEDNVYIDASEQVMGRMSSIIAKELLKGKKVYVINSGKSVISGNRKYILKDYKEKIDRGDPYHGPFYPKAPERIIKRVVRGMLPKNPKGRDALARLRVYRSKPSALEGKEFKKYSDAKIGNSKSYLNLEKVSERLG